MMRWWWFGPSVQKTELARELRAMKRGGIGGVELQTTYPLTLDDPAHGLKNVPFLSASYLDSLHFASDKARELGLRFDLTPGSGWPSGGPHIPVDHAAAKLRYVAVPVTPGTANMPLPKTETGEKLLAAFVAQGDQERFHPEGLLRLDDSQIENGRVSLPAQSSDGPRVVLFFIASRTGMKVKRPAFGAEGLVLDHFDREAAQIHLHDVGDRLLAAFGAHPPYAIFSDSLEVYGSDWTGDLLEEFRRRRGYDLTPYLPALIEDIGSVTSDVRHDWGETLTELIQERYLTPVHVWARQHHTWFRSQTYGIPAVSLSSNSFVDLPEGEGEQWRSFTPTRWASSASHLFGSRITSSETWTWLHSPPFRATPLDMKAAADLYFLQGVNQLIGHGWPYSPKGIPEPGWSFYAAAVFNDHNPWWIVMPDVTRYLQRVSYALRQGKPVNDVAVLLPTDDAWSKFHAGHDSVSELMGELLGPEILPRILDAGFNLDFVDTEAIHKLGIHYPVLILPGVERLPLATYQIIEEYARKGGIVIATRRTPSLAPGLLKTKADTPQVREISRRLFQAHDSIGHFVHEDRELGAALDGFLKPDVAMSPRLPEIGVVHRKLSFADIYFLANTSNQPVHTQAVFRANKKYAQWFDPMSGKFFDCDKRVTLAVNLQPYESRILIFSNQKNPAGHVDPAFLTQGALPPLDLSKNWDVTFAAPLPPVHMNELRSWTADSATKFYSGLASYKKTFVLPALFIKGNQRLYLDFGEGKPTTPEGHKESRTQAWIESPVRESAEVFVNGRKAGSVWHPPYTVDVTGLLHAGPNELKIIVGNLAINTLASRPPADYHALNSHYGERFVPQDMNNLEPVPSGLLGSIQLRAMKAPSGSATHSDTASSDRE